MTEHRHYPDQFFPECDTCRLRRLRHRIARIVVMIDVQGGLQLQEVQKELRSLLNAD